MLKYSELKNLIEVKLSYEIEKTPKTVQFVLDGDYIFSMRQEEVWEYPKNLKRWFIRNKEGKELGSTTVGYTKSEGLAQMKRYMKHYMKHYI